MQVERACPQVGDYVLLSTLGSGSTGKVKLAEHKFTGQKVAIKIVPKSEVEEQPDLAIKLRREISLMHLFDNPHLLKLVDVCESSRHLYIVLEYASHGELFDYLVERGSLSIDQSLRFFRQMIFGLDYLHAHAICHRDLKPENILLDEHDNVKIADFGFARWMKTNIVDTSCGSPHYASPEVIKGEPYDGRKSDIWSAGVVFYTLLCGRLPFEDNSIRGLLMKVKSGVFRMPPDFPNDIKDLIQRMLTVDPAKRISLSEIKAHPAFRRDLPPSYTFPSPLPVPVLNDPIEPSTLDQSTMDVLHQLGFENEEELISELKSNQHTMAKVFVYILSHRMSFDNLPWNFTEDDDDFINSQGFFVPAGNPMLSGGSIHANDPFFRRTSADLSSPQDYSIIERSLLAEDAPTIACNATKTIKEIVVPLESLFNALQIFLTEQNFSWFYPNEMKLLARRKNDQIDLIFESDIDIDENIILKISLPQGNHLIFDHLVEQIEQMIECIIP